MIEAKTKIIQKYLVDEKLPVTLGNMFFTQNPEKYNFLGIGTCIGIYMYDLKQCKYYLAHTVLPEYEKNPNRYSKKMPAKFTDLAIHLMYKKLLAENCLKIKCKIVGGGQIYQDSFNIGERNIKSAINALKDRNIPLIAKDVGGTQSRSILAFKRDGTINIRKKGEYFSI